MYCVLSVMLGLEKGLNRSDVKDLSEGAILHDIGKLFIPDEILNKNGPLTDEEFELVRRHTSDGFEVLRRNEVSASSPPMSHTNTMNGSTARAIRDG